MAPATPIHNAPSGCPLFRGPRAVLHVFTIQPAPHLFNYWPLAPILCTLHTCGRLSFRNATHSRVWDVRSESHSLSKIYRQWYPISHDGEREQEIMEVMDSGDHHEAL